MTQSRFLEAPLVRQADSELQKKFTLCCMCVLMKKSKPQNKVVISQLFFFILGKNILPNCLSSLRVNNLGGNYCLPTLLFHPELLILFWNISRIWCFLFQCQYPVRKLTTNRGRCSMLDSKTTSRAEPSINKNLK